MSDDESPQLFSPYDQGAELDADLGLAQETSNRFSLFFESLGGKPPRNLDYNRALQLLLERLGHERATITRIDVLSLEALKRPANERCFEPAEFPLPLDLHRVEDFHRLRQKIGGRAAKTARTARAKKSSSGNSQKRLRISLSFDSKNPPTHEALLRSLIQEPNRYQAGSSASVAADSERDPSTRSSSSGQGRESDPELRQAVEEYAMCQAEAHYKGWQATRRDLEHCGYDIEFGRGAQVRTVEVKGTRSVSPRRVTVTANEVRYACAHRTQAVLLVVSGIEYEQGDGGPVCSGGKISVFEDWGPTDWNDEVGSGLIVKDYYFTLPRSS